LNKALVKDFKNRASSGDLLKHEFITTAQSTSELGTTTEEKKAIVQNVKNFSKMHRLLRTMLSILVNMTTERDDL